MIKTEKLPLQVSLTTKQATITTSLRKSKEMTKTWFTMTWLQTSPSKSLKKSEKLQMHLSQASFTLKTQPLITKSKNLKTRISTSTCLKPFTDEALKKVNSPLTFVMNKGNSLPQRKMTKTVVCHLKTSLSHKLALTPTLSLKKKERIKTSFMTPWRHVFKSLLSKKLVINSIC